MNPPIARVAFQALLLGAVLAELRAVAADFAAPSRDFMEDHCFNCHDAETKKGGLDLENLTLDLTNPWTFAEWIKIHDRVRDGEMPPKKKARPPEAERAAFLSAVAQPMIAADMERGAQEGRATWRRLNRYEYESTLRDLLGVPWLQVRDMLPEDGEAHRFNKVGDALDVSHVQMARYFAAAEYALREVLEANAAPAASTRRYYAREQRGFTPHKPNLNPKLPERGMFMLLGDTADLSVIAGEAPVPGGEKDPARRGLEAVGVLSSTYEPVYIKFDGFRAPAAGRYRLRVSAYSFWAAPESGELWWKASRTRLSAGRTREPVGVYAQSPPNLVRKLGAFDVTPEPAVNELEVQLLKGETIQPDAVRLMRSRPPGTGHNPLAEKDGQPGVAFRWLEVEGPLPEPSVHHGLHLLFGDLAVTRLPDGRTEVATLDPAADAERLLRSFLARVYRRPVEPDDPARFLRVISKARVSGSSFADAMITGYAAVLCSPAFVTLEERPGRLDDDALACRLAYFLWNSSPDAELRALAASGSLHEPAVLGAQTERLLADTRSQRFEETFLAYWLDLRKTATNSPDASLYPDYYLDDFLIESAVDETRAFFHELVRHDLPARNIVHSDFVMVNERLANHYGLTGIEGVAIRRVPLPDTSPRGGLLTQASVLKVTANGTTTSPVLRGAWIMERILGRPVPPPPPGVPAVEPDTRGATTIREQLSLHRDLAACASCHAKMDPAGFALENFDILGGWRDRYRALGEGPYQPGFGKNGQPFEFRHAQPVDASGELPDGRTFRDIREFKRLLLEDEKQIARNLVGHLTVFATGAAVRFGDRPEVERILERSSRSGFGVKSIIHELVQSSLFQEK
jgi:hypothetical protein